MWSVFLEEASEEERPGQADNLGSPWQIGQGVSFIPFDSLASERCKSDKVKEALHYSPTRW
ncbi:Uncharacterised protein [uncultured archaeon]|nr:Uncharacterised protein [uncultured archaeon]